MKLTIHSVGRSLFLACLIPLIARGEEANPVNTDLGTGLSGSINTAVNGPTTNDTSLPLVFLLEAQPVASEEGPTPGQLLVVRFGDTNATLEVAYVVGGTAANEIDYQPLLGRVRIPAGQHVAPITIIPVDDNAGEARETVVVELSHPGTNLRGFRIQWPGRGVVTIQDNDGGANQPPTVSLLSPPAGAVFRGPLNVPLFATADDTDGFVQSVEFFAGNLSLGTVSNRFRPFALIDPANIENTVAANQRVSGDFDPDAPNLTTGTSVLPPVAPFSLVWSNAPVGEHLVRAVATDDRGATRSSEAVRVRIESDTALPLVGVFAKDSRAGEGGPGDASGTVDTATFIIHRTGSAVAELAVDLRFGGSATPGSDYQAIATTVLIPADEREVALTIEPINDTDEEDRESIVLELQPAACADLFPAPAGCYELAPNARAVAWIEDNDRIPTNHPPVVRLERPEANTVLVSPTHYPLIAAAQDLDGWVRTVEFFDGEKSLGTVSNQPSLLADANSPAVAILPPWHLVWTNIAPGSHVLRAVATDNLGASRDSAPVAVRVVGTNSPPVVSILASDNLAREPDPVNGSPNSQPNTAKFRIRRTGSQEKPLTVHFHVGGSAVNGEDYRAIARHVTIPAGVDGADVLIEPIDDTRVEGPENIVLSLRPVGANDTTAANTSSDYIIGTPFRAEAILRDNDTDAVNRPPEALILQPTAGAVLKLGDPIKILARGKDADGHLVRLEAFADGVQVADKSLQYFETPPVGMSHTFELVWPHPSTGEHEIRVRVTDNDGASRLSEPVRVKVIEQVERTVVSVVAIDTEASEGIPSTPAGEANVGVFSLRRRGNLTIPVEVAYSLRGSASPNDFELVSGNATGSGTTTANHSARFAAGQTEVRLVLRPVDDQRVEQTETVTLQIEAPLCIALFPPPPGCYQVGTEGTATISIRDNDEHRNEPPRVVIASPETGAKFTAPARIEIAAQTRDQDGWVTQMEFYVGDRKLGDSVVHFLVPPAPDARQRFSLAWTNAPAGEHVLRVKATDNLGASRWSEPVTVRVREENAVPIIEIITRDFLAREGANAAGQPDTATFTLIRRGSTNAAIHAFLEIGGVAENGADYQQVPTGITIPAGETKVEIEITPIDDDTPERGESVILNLVHPQTLLPLNYEIGLRRRAAAMIADNDRIEPRPGTEPPAAAEALTDGVVHVVVIGDLTEEVVVEGTDNLRDWFEIARGFMADGRIDFVEADALSRAGRFYRVIPAASGIPVVGAQRVFDN